MIKRNAIYAQSGGVTAVINATAAGVIETAREYPKAIGRVLAGRNGVLGVLREDLIDTRRESKKAVETLRQTPGGAFGSCRYKLKNAEANDPDIRRLFDVFDAHNVGYFFYNGGGDSQDTANKISEIGDELGYPIQCIGIPKTVDNDLAKTDTCPGFGSVAKYVAVSTKEAALDIASMAETSTKVFILEVMGRHAGWIAASGGLAGDSRREAPHIILFPEVTFSRTRFINEVARVVKRVGYCVVVASEGIRDESGEFLSATGGKDAFGHSQLGGVGSILADIVNQDLGLKYHYGVADYLQRSARHIASGIDVEQAYAVGAAAVKFAVAGEDGIMVSIQRTKDWPYRWKIGKVPLRNVANIERKMPKAYITKDGFGITKKARDYLKPLIQGEAYPSYRHGMPQYVELKNEPVAKKLPKYEVG